MAGPLALVGGDEFRPGNEPQDTLLRDAAAGRPAYILPTAAGADAPQAVATAQRWFAGLGLEVQELPVRTPTDARSAALAQTAEDAGLVYIAGGDPGRVTNVLRGSAVWDGMRRGWEGGAALAGSSAGAMALGEWTLVRAGFPGHTQRRPIPALRLLPGCAVLPHFDAFGERWIPSAQAALGDEALLIGIDERTAAVWQEGRWSVMGAGLVTLVRGGSRHTFTAADEVPDLPQPGE
jgi:cyanophycinase